MVIPNIYSNGKWTRPRTSGWRRRSGYTEGLGNFTSIVNQSS